LTSSAPTWVNVTAYPAGVEIVIVRPCVGTLPAKVTVPAAGDRIASAASAPTSMPRCWPAAYGSEPKTNGRSSGPSAGQVHASATAGATSARADAAAAATTFLGVVHIDNMKTA
jgi:hypothetical protein